jgi:hypothetical protein
MTAREEEVRRIICGVNTQTEITPLAQRQYPWTLDYESPNYAKALGDEETRNDPVARQALDRRGFKISLSQACLPDPQGGGVMRAVPNAVCVSAWIGAAASGADKIADDIEIDGGIVDLAELQAFADMLSEMVHVAARGGQLQRKDAGA